MMTPELSTNGHRHAEPARSQVRRLARIERRLTEIHESGETRVTVLRIADFTASELAALDEEIAKLQNQIADLTHKLVQKTAVDQLVNKAIARLDARQIARDEAKRGPKAIGASAELEASKVHRERPAQQEN